MQLRKLLVVPLVLAASHAIAFAGDLEDGLELKAAGKFEQALPKLEKALAADPKKAAAALALSQVLSGVGKHERAARVLREAIEANPDDVSLLVQRGRAYVLLAAQTDAEKGDPNMILSSIADADRSLKAALAKDPKNSEARVLKAKAQAFQGADQEKVVEELRAVVADDPKCFDAHWELGTIEMRRARAGAKASWGASEKHFRDAFAADPTSGQALLQATYAKAWQQVARAPELISDYAQCAALLPGQEAPALAIWKLRKQAAAEARAALEKLAKDSAQGGRPKAFLALLDGEGALAAGKGDAAVSAYCKAAEEYGAGDGKDVYFALYGAVVQAKGLDGDQRDKICEAAWKRWPHRSEVPNDFALWNRDVSHDYKRSLKWYLRAAEAAPNSPRVLNDTGLIYHYHMNEFDKAEPWYRKAVQAAEEQGVEPSNDPNDEGMGYRDAMNNIVKILSAQKRWKELREFADKHVPEGFPGRSQWLEAGKDK